MSEFNAYLDRLRGALDVSSQRADEILAEARTHLEAKAAELEAGGLSRAEAVRAAIADFGDAEPTAQALTRANGRHRGFSLFRLLLAVGVTAGATATVTGFTGRGDYLDALGWAMAARWKVAFEDLAMLAMLVGLIPAALVAGAIGGRRGWWVAATPAIFWGFIGFPRMMLHGGPAAVLQYIVLWPALMVVVLGAMGRLGEAASVHRRARTWVIAVLAVYLAFGPVLVMPMLPDARFLIAAVVTVQITCLVLLVVAQREDLLTRRRLVRLGAMGLMACGLAVGSTAWVAVLAAPAGMVALPPTRTWSFMAVGTVFAVGAVLGYYRYLDRRGRDDAPIVTE